MIYNSFEEWISSPSNNDEKQLFKQYENNEIDTYHFIIEFAKKAYNICEEKNKEEIKSLKKQAKALEEALEEEIGYLKANPEDVSEEGV